MGFVENADWKCHVLRRTFWSLDVVARSLICLLSKTSLYVYTSTTFSNSSDLLLTSYSAIKLLATSYNFEGPKWTLRLKASSPSLNNLQTMGYHLRDQFQQHLGPLVHVAEGCVSRLKLENIPLNTPASKKLIQNEIFGRFQFSNFFCLKGLEIFFLIVGRQNKTFTLFYFFSENRDFLFFPEIRCFSVDRNFISLPRHLTTFMAK